jgi:hypothetical protein
VQQLRVQRRELRFGGAEMPGRKPKPYHLKIVSGNPGRRPLHGPPAAVPGAVERPPLLRRRKAEPDHMTRARELWAEKAPTLVRLEILNPVTATGFGNWCELQARYEVDPAAFTAAQLAQLRALGSCYGLDAIAWEKVSAGRDDAASDDPAAEFFTAG